MEGLEYAARIQKGTARGDDPATRPLHFSPAYWDYWDWYTKITGGKIKGKNADKHSANGKKLVTEGKA